MLARARRGSDLNWSVTGLVSCQAWESTSLEFGYRALASEFEESGAVVSTDLDVLIHGPMLSITVTW